jgi:hypothetical protein
VIPDRHRIRNEKRGSGGTDRRLRDALPIPRPGLIGGRRDRIAARIILWRERQVSL